MAVAQLRCDVDSSEVFHIQIASMGWLAVQHSKAIFFLTLYGSINDMKYLWNICITTQPCHSHFCCWLLPIWPKLGIWAENGAYDMYQIGWRYNGSKLYFYWPYIIVSMILKTSELSALHLSRATATFVVDCCQFGPSWMFGLKMELMACANLVGGTTEQSCLFPNLIWKCQWYETLPKCLH